MKLRARLAKEGLARFFSHLDVQRTLERTLRRSGLPLAYSQGFNPHPKFSFASALATGASSTGEFFDLDLTEPVAPEAFVTRFNQSAPPGLRVIEVRALEGKRESLTSLLNAAEYLLVLDLPASHRTALEEGVAAFLASEVVEVTKETKRGSQVVNIRPQVYRLQVAAETGALVLRGLVQSSAQGNLKPEDLLAGVKQVGPALEGANLELVHRLMLYRRNPETGDLVEPWEL